MPNNKYRVKFKLEGGALVTKVILAPYEGAAAIRAVTKFKAVAVLEIKRV